MMMVGPSPTVPEDPCADKVDDAFAPARALHEERLLPAVDEAVDGLPLTLAEQGLRRVQGRTKEAERALLRPWTVSHRHHLSHYNILLEGVVKPR